MLSTVRAADDPRLRKGGLSSDAGKQNGAVNHSTTAETELVGLKGSQQEAVATPAKLLPPRPAPAAATAAENGALSTSGAHPAGAQRSQDAEPSLQPQLLQRLGTLREALDGRSLQGPQRSVALRAFATLCLACSPPATQAAGQVCSEPTPYSAT